MAGDSGDHCLHNVCCLFVCLFVVHKGHRCIQGTWKWKHMIYGHFLSEFESLNNDSFVNFEILILGFEKCLRRWFCKFEMQNLNKIEVWKKKIGKGGSY